MAGYIPTVEGVMQASHVIQFAIQSWGTCLDLANQRSCWISALVALAIHLCILPMHLRTRSEPDASLISTE